MEIMMLGVIAFFILLLKQKSSTPSQPKKPSVFDRSEEIWDEQYDDADDADEGDDDDN